MAAQAQQDGIVRPKILIPFPHSQDHEYSTKWLPLYVEAVQHSGGDAITVPLDTPLDQIDKLYEECSGVVLPGSPADVDPAIYGHPRHEATAPPDELRYAADTLLVTRSFEKRKAILGICFGCQSLNVLRGGTLTQHVFDHTQVPHTAGAYQHHAHPIRIKKNSYMARMFTTYKMCCLVSGLSAALNASKSIDLSQLSTAAKAPIKPKTKTPENTPVLENAKNDEDIVTTCECECDVEDCLWPINSSHHQCVETVGPDLHVVAMGDDGIIEAVEGHYVGGPEDRRHFVMGVQWHPERFFQEDHLSQALFQNLVDAARECHIRTIKPSQPHTTPTLNNSADCNSADL